VQALRRMREPAPAIVMVLARSEALAAESAIAAGAADVLIGPFDASLLANKVELAVRLSRQGASADSDWTPWPEPSQGDGAERRRFVRQSLCETLRLRPVGDVPFGSGRLLDVSEAAAKVQAQQPLAVGTWVELDCPFLADLLDRGGRPVPSRVIRQAAEHPEHVYASSLAGIGETETQRVRRWIFAEQARRVRVPGPDRPGDR